VPKKGDLLPGQSDRLFHRLERPHVYRASTGGLDVVRIRIFALQPFRQRKKSSSGLVGLYQGKRIRGRESLGRSHVFAGGDL